MRDYQKDLDVCEKATEEPWEWRIKKEVLVDEKDRRFGFFVGDLKHPTVEKSAALIITTEENKHGVKDIICFKNEDKEFIPFARTTLPWYIKRCMEMESQIQHAHEREAALREALEYIEWYPGDLRDFCPSCLRTKGNGHSEFCRIKKALSSPFQPPNRVVELEAQNAALRRIFEEMDTLTNVRDNDPEFCWLADTESVDKLYDLIDQALSSPSQPSRHREALAVVKAARELLKFLRTNDLTIAEGVWIKRLADALTAYEKAGEGAGNE